MQPEQPNINLSKALLGGLLTGIAAAIVNLIYIIIFRESMDYARFGIATALVIFTFFPLLLLLLGGFYFLMVRHLRKGTLTFSLLIMLVTILLILETLLNMHATGRPWASRDGLLMGSEILTGLLAAFLIPYFVRHPQLYQ